MCSLCSLEANEHFGKTQVQLEFFIGSRKTMECVRKREKDRKPVVLLCTCDSGQICEVFVIMMQCEESSCGEKKKKKTC